MKVAIWFPILMAAILFTTLGKTIICLIAWLIKGAPRKPGKYATRKTN